MAQNHNSVPTHQTSTTVRNSSRGKHRGGGGDGGDGRGSRGGKQRIESQAGNKGIKRRWCDEGWGWGWVKEARMSSGMDRVLRTGPPAGPILTLSFASITAPLSTSGSTRSRSPLIPTECRGVHPCDTTTWDDKKRRRKTKTHHDKRITLVSARQYHHHNHTKPTYHNPNTLTSLGIIEIQHTTTKTPWFRT
jgi:hypothetical protein